MYTPKIDARLSKRIEKYKRDLIEFEKLPSCLEKERSIALTKYLLELAEGEAEKKFDL